MLVCCRFPCHTPITLLQSVTDLDFTVRVERGTSYLYLRHEDAHSYSELAPSLLLERPRWWCCTIAVLVEGWCDVPRTHQRQKSSSVQRLQRDQSRHRIPVAHPSAAPSTCIAGTSALALTSLLHMLMTKFCQCHTHQLFLGHTSQSLRLKYLRCMKQTAQWLLQQAAYGMTVYPLLRAVDSRAE